MAYTKSAVRLGGAYVEISADSRSLSRGLQDAEAMTRDFSSNVAAIGAAMSGLGLAIILPMKEAVESYAEFEKQMLITQAVTKATEAQLGRLTGQAKELGATTSWTASQVAEGMVSLGRMGFSTNEIENSIASVMDLGRALDVNVGTAAKELGSVMRQFGASAWEAGKYADVLAKATNSSATAMSELLDTMKYVGTAGNAIGADVETVLALTMALRNAGLSASQAGTQLRTMFLKLQNPKNINKFAEDFGVDIYDANGRLKSFLDILIEAQRRASVMGDKLAVVARNMFGVLQAPGFMTLLQSKELESFRDELYNADGAAEDFRKGMESGVFGSLKLVESAVEAIGLQLGESLAPTLNNLVGLVQAGSAVLRSFISDNGVLVGVLAESAIKFLSVGTALVTAAVAMKAFAVVSKSAVGIISFFADAWRKASAQHERYIQELVKKETDAARAFGLAEQDVDKIGIVAEKRARKATRGMTALQLAVNGVRKAAMALGAAFLSMAVWQGVAAIFDAVAKKVREAAEALEKARNNISEAAQKDEKDSAEAKGQVESDEQKIDELVSGAGSKRKLNAVEAKRLETLFNDLNERGLVNGNVVVDKNSPSGFRVVDAGAANRMKALAVGKQLDDLTAKNENNYVDLHALDPTAFAKGSSTRQKDLKHILDEYRGGVNALEYLNDSQKEMLFGEMPGVGGRLADFVGFDGQSLWQKIKNADNPNDRAAIIDETVRSLHEKGTLSPEIEKDLKNFLMIATRENNDYQNSGFWSHVLGENFGTGGLDFLASLTNDKGEGFIKAFHDLEQLADSKTDAAIEELKGLKAAYEKEAESGEGKEYKSQEDAQRDAIERETATEKMKETLDNVGADSKKLTAKEKLEADLKAFDAEWTEYAKTFLKNVMDADDWAKEMLAYWELEKDYYKKRATLQEKINAEIEKQAKEEEKRAKEEKKRKSKEESERLSGSLDAMISAILHNDWKGANTLGRDIDGDMNAALQNELDVSAFYQESVSKIADAISRTQVTLTSTGTFNPYEFLDMGNDVELDVQREQLANLREANRGLRNIYAWMQTDDRFKEYM